MNISADAAERCFRSIYPDTMGDDALWQEQLEWTRSAENVNAKLIFIPSKIFGSAEFKMTFVKT